MLLVQEEYACPQHESLERQLLFGDVHLQVRLCQFLLGRFHGISLDEVANVSVCVLDTDLFVPEVLHTKNLLLVQQVGSVVTSNAQTSYKRLILERKLLLREFFQVQLIRIEYAD